MPGSTDDVNPPQVMTQHQKVKMRTAAFKVHRLFPSNIAKLLELELQTWQEFGYLLGSGSVIKGAVDEIMNMPVPDISPSPPTPVTPSVSSHLKSAVGYE
jgi:hypothetical protein